MKEQYYILVRSDAEIEYARWAASDYDEGDVRTFGNGNTTLHQDLVDGFLVLFRETLRKRGVKVKVRTEYSLESM